MVARTVTGRGGGRGPAAWVRNGGLSTLLFFVPALIVFGFFAWWPIVQSVLLSLQHTNFVTSQWVGLKNFRLVLRDPLLGTAVRNSSYYTLLALIFGFPVPVLAATFIAELRRSRGFASVLCYLPVMLPPVAAVLLWKTFYDPSPTGPLNTMLGWLGVGPVAWLNDPHLVIPAIVVQATWASFGGATVIYIAALTGVRADLYEAAELDGAGIARRFWHVALPQLRPVLLTMLLLQVIGTFQIFTEPFVMTGGGPQNASLTLLMLIYRYAFVSGDFGRATALSVLLAGTLSLLAAVYLRLTRSWSTT